MAACLLLVGAAVLATAAWGTSLSPPATAGIQQALHSLQRMDYALA